MNKSTILANIASKIKSKVGLINKTQHGEVHEDIVNEVYGDFIVANNANQTIFGRESTFYDFEMKVKKVGNQVFFTGSITANGTLQGAAYPRLEIKNSAYFGYFDDINLFPFNFTCLKASFSSNGFIEKNYIEFSEYVSGLEIMTFSGHYFTKNL